MKIKMVAHISGTRDGADWPAPGGILEVPYVEGTDLIRSGLAVLADPVGAPEKAVARKPESRKGLTKGSI